MYENFTYWADRVNKLSGGSLKVETMAAGQVVPPFEVLDAARRCPCLDRLLGWQEQSRRSLYRRPGRTVRYGHRQFDGLDV